MLYYTITKVFHSTVIFCMIMIGNTLEIPAAKAKHTTAKNSLIKNDSFFKVRMLHDVLFHKFSRLDLDFVVS